MENSPNDIESRVRAEMLATFDEELEIDDARIAQLVDIAEATGSATPARPPL